MEYNNFNNEYHNNVDNSRLMYMKFIQANIGQTISIVANKDDTADEGGDSLVGNNKFYWSIGEYSGGGAYLYSGGWRNLTDSWTIGDTEIGAYPYCFDRAQRREYFNKFIIVFRWNNGDSSFGSGTDAIIDKSSVASYYPKFYLVCAPFKYTFKLNGGNVSGNTSNISKERLGITNITAPTQPTRTGYTFTGWKITSQGGKQKNKVYTTAQLNTMFTDAKYYSSLFEDATFEAQWKKNTYTVNQYHYKLHPPDASHSESYWIHFDTTTTTKNYGESFTPYNVTSPTGYHPSNNYSYYDSSDNYIGDGTVGTDSFTVYGDMKVHVHYYPYYILDLNHYLDENVNYGEADYFTCDIYVDGQLKANDVSDANIVIYWGQKWEVKDIKCNGVVYCPDKSTGVSGTTNSNDSPGDKYAIYLDFRHTYRFDLNEQIQDTVNWWLTDGRTCDVYIDDVQIADDVDNYDTYLPYGTKWEIKDVKASKGNHLAGSITRDMNTENYIWGQTYSGTLTYDLSYYLYFAWNEYTLTINPNGGSFTDDSGTNNKVCNSPPLYYNYGNYWTIDFAIPKKTGSTLTGFYDAPTGGTKVYNADGTCVNGTKYWNDNLYKLAGDLTVYANWESNQYEICFDANGGTGTMNPITATFDVPVQLPSNTFIKTTSSGNSTFLYWEDRENNKTYADMETVINLTTDSSITLYAIWDDTPVIEAQTRYFTLLDAQNGKITHAELLSTIMTSDDIDKDIWEKVTVKYYDSEEWKQFTSDGASDIIYTVTDSAGNTAEVICKVYITDTSAKKVIKNTYVRSISPKYYQESPENGGLELNSIWRTNPEYAAVLNSAMENRESLQFEKIDRTYLGIRLQKDVPGSISRNHAYETWHLTSENVAQIKEYINVHGIGNLKEPDALKNFREQFSNCISK